MIEAIVLAGGFGTRLREVVSDLPKPMAPIGGKPFLAYLLENMAKNGINRAILSVGYMSEKIIEYFGNAYAGMELKYCIEDEPLGTGGAIKKAIELIKGDHVYVFNGDTYLNFRIEELEKDWFKNKKSRIVCVNVESSKRYGALDIASDTGRIRGIREEGNIGPQTINAGCYLLNVQQFENFNEKKFSFEQDFLKKNLVKGGFYSYLTNGYFIDIGIPEDFEVAKRYFLKTE